MGEDLGSKDLERERSTTSGLQRWGLPLRLPPVLTRAVRTEALPLQHTRLVSVPIVPLPLVRAAFTTQLTLSFIHVHILPLFHPLPPHLPLSTVDHRDH